MLNKIEIEGICHTIKIYKTKVRLILKCEEQAQGYLKDAYFICMATGKSAIDTLKQATIGQELIITGQLKQHTKAHPYKDEMTNITYINVITAQSIGQPVNTISVLDIKAKEAAHKQMEQL